jgi:hypothetical protein
MKKLHIYTGVQGIIIDGKTISTNTMVKVLQQTETTALVETVYTNQGTRFQCLLEDLKEIVYKDKPKVELDYTKISNVNVTNIDFADAPDFTDANIDYAEYNGIAMDDDLLDLINEDMEYVQKKLQEQLN